MKRLYEHIEGVNVTPKFAKEKGLNYRYRLDISLKNPAHANKTACVVMQNPSYAGKDVADKSVQFMEKVVFQKGLSEFADVQRLIVVNQFARIQTNHFQGLSHEAGSQNNAIIESVLNESDIIILGWGSSKRSKRFEERKAFVLGLLRKMNGKQLFKTKTHPSRGRYDGFIQPFNF